MSYPAPLMATNIFMGNIFWLLEQSFKTGSLFSLRCSTKETSCTAEKIAENPNELRMNEAGMVVFKTAEFIVVEKYPVIEALGMFVIDYKDSVAGAGIIYSIYPASRDQEFVRF